MTPRLTTISSQRCYAAAGTGTRVLRTMAKGLAGHATGILNGWVHRISKGRMEGINNEINAMLRLLHGLLETKFKLTGC